MIAQERRLSKLETTKRPISSEWQAITVREGEDEEACILAKFGARPENLIIRRIVSPTGRPHVPAA